MADLGRPVVHRGCFWPGVTREDLVQLDARVLASMDQRGRVLERVRYLGALLLPTDEVFCFFDAPSADAVETVARRAKIPFERILRSVNVPSAGRGQRP